MIETDKGISQDTHETEDIPEEERHTVSVSTDELKLIANKFAETHKWMRTHTKTAPFPTPIDVAQHPKSRASILTDAFEKSLEKSKEAKSPTAQFSLGATDLDLVTIFVIPYTTREENIATLKKVIAKKNFVFTEEVITLMTERAIPRERAVFALNTAWVQAGGEPRESFLKRSALFPKK